MAAKEPVAKGSRATSALTNASFLGEPGKEWVKVGIFVHVTSWVAKPSVSQATWNEQAGEALYRPHQPDRVPACASFAKTRVTSITGHLSCRT